MLNGDGMAGWDEDWASRIGAGCAFVAIINAKGSA